MSPKYIIMCWPRSGSSLLDESLGEHPNLKRGGELFNRTIGGKEYHVKWREGVFRELFNAEQKDMRRNSEWLYDEYDFVAYAKRVFQHFNGFKFIYDQLRIESDVMQYFHSLSDLKIIFLKRNLLDSVASFHQAGKKQVWFRKGGDPVDYPPLELTRGDVQWFIDTYDKESQCRELFLEHQTITVHYNELAHYWNDTMAHVLEFLGVEVMPLKQAALKISRVPSKITNYEQLVQEFAETRHAVHFRQSLYG